MPASADDYAGSQDEVRGGTYSVVGPIVCKNTAITNITDRFGKAYGSGPPIMGTNVTFANGTRVVSYSLDRVVDRERAGDKVQLCFLGRVAGMEGCDPAKDGRGFIYRVYDYRLHQAYTMMNSQHICGGA